ncbi:hypothetical protein [Fibrobacter succinogenes]|uniref:hypothetical protein n=1 Tax=Fibrobacter succinogenes TaxID=833 RepID=UPI0013D73A13|nr:hypothetical protein [Fibrobacter succinogenes]
MKKKNKWYEVLGASLLSVSAMYLCTSLVVTGCSVDDGSLDALDANETSEVVESGSDEEVESSEVEKSSKPEETSKEEAEASESEEQEPADAEETAEAEETADAEEKPTTTPETEEPAESGDETAPEESTEPEETAEPAEPAEPAETTEPAEPETPVETTEPDGGKKVARHTREWYDLRDTVSYFIQEECWRDKNALEKLEKNRYSLISRCEWDIEVNDCSMEESAFHAAYQSNEDVMRKLTDAGILWDGSEWEGWNPIEDGESTVVLDTALSAWSNGRVYVHAVYRVSYHLNSDPDTEHSFLLDVPVKYMRVD